MCWARNLLTLGVPCACLLLAFLGARGEEAPRHPLADDRHLAVRIHLDLPKPTFEDLLDALEEATKLKMTAPDELSDQVAVSGFTVQGAPAWQVMDEIARTMTIDGRWEKTEKGYHLTGKAKFAPEQPIAAPPPPPPRFPVTRVVLGLAALALLAGVPFLVRYVRARRALRAGVAGKSAPPAEVADAPPQG